MNVGSSIDIEAIARRRNPGAFVPWLLADRSWEQTSSENERRFRKAVDDAIDVVRAQSNSERRLRALNDAAIALRSGAVRP